MTGLTFTAVKKATPPPPEKRHWQPNYLALAQELSAQIRTQWTALELYEATITDLRERVRNGRRWLATHPAEHPRRERNLALLRRLEWELDTAEWARRHRIGVLLDLSVGLYGAYDALSPIEQAAVDVNDIERPDHERYWQATNHWERKEI